MEATSYERPAPRSDRSLSEAERIVSDSIGRLIEFWGFKRNMGRVWAVLYLSARPLSAKDLRARLQLSSGAVSMTLNELQRWGVVRKHWVPGERCDFFLAESNLWKMISRVLRERERLEVVEALHAFEDAMGYLERGTEGRSAEELELQRARIRQLLEVARMGRSMLDALVSSARMDARWLSRVLPDSR